MSFEVITLGEAMLRLSVPAGTPFEAADQLDLHVAGAEANTAIGLAQLGRSVTWVSSLPETPIGRRVSRELQAYGVDVSHVRWSGEERMGIYYVELAAPPRPVRVVYDRAGSTAAAMTPADFPFDLLDKGVERRIAEEGGALVLHSGMRLGLHTVQQPSHKPRLADPSFTRQ